MHPHQQHPTMQYHPQQPVMQQQPFMPQPVQPGLPPQFAPGQMAGQPMPLTGQPTQEMRQELRNNTSARSNKPSSIAAKPPQVPPQVTTVELLSPAARALRIEAETKRLEAEKARARRETALSFFFKKPETKEAKKPETKATLGNRARAQVAEQEKLEKEVEAAKKEHEETEKKGTPTREEKKRIEQLKAVHKTAQNKVKSLKKEKEATDARIQQQKTTAEDANKKAFRLYEWRMWNFEMFFSKEFSMSMSPAKGDDWRAVIWKNEFLEKESRSREIEALQWQEVIEDMTQSGSNQSGSNSSNSENTLPEKEQELLDEYKQAHQAAKEEQDRLHKEQKETIVEKVRKQAEEAKTDEQETQKEIERRKEDLQNLQQRDEKASEYGLEKDSGNNAQTAVAAELEALYELSDTLQSLQTACSNFLSEAESLEKVEKERVLAFIEKIETAAVDTDTKKMMPASSTSNDAARGQPQNHTKKANPQNSSTNLLEESQKSLNKAVDVANEAKIAMETAKSNTLQELIQLAEGDIPNAEKAKTEVETCTEEAHASKQFHFGPDFNGKRVQEKRIAYESSYQAFECLRKSCAKEEFLRQQIVNSLLSVTSSNLSNSFTSLATQTLSTAQNNLQRATKNRAGAKKDEDYYKGKYEMSKTDPHLLWDESQELLKQTKPEREKTKKLVDAAERRRDETRTSVEEEYENDENRTKSQAQMDPRYVMTLYPLEKAYESAIQAFEADIEAREWSSALSAAALKRHSEKSASSSAEKSSQQKKGSKKGSSASKQDTQKASSQQPDSFESQSAAEVFSKETETLKATLAEYKREHNKLKNFLALAPQPEEMPPIPVTPCENIDDGSLEFFGSSLCLPANPEDAELYPVLSSTPLEELKLLEPVQPAAAVTVKLPSEDSATRDLQVLTFAKISKQTGSRFSFVSLFSLQSEFTSAKARLC